MDPSSRSPRDSESVAWPRRRATGGAGRGQAPRNGAGRAGRRRAAAAEPGGGPPAERGRGDPSRAGGGGARGARTQAAPPAEVGLMDRYRPMLAVPAVPFDAPEYLFEVKWN